MIGEDGEAEGKKRMGYKRRRESAIWSLNEVWNLEPGVWSPGSGAGWAGQAGQALVGDNSFGRS